MDLLLIDPPYKALKGVVAECAYSAGPLALAAYLREGGIDCGVLVGDLFMDVPPTPVWDFDVEKYAAGQGDYANAVDDEQHPVWQRLRDAVEAHRPKMVGIPYMTPLKHAVERVARLVKQIDEGTKVIVGGHHPTFCPEETIQNADIDVVVVGEGEVPLLGVARELLRPNPDLSSVPGLCYKEGGRAVTTPCTELLSDLDELPFPAWDLLLDYDFGRYTGHLATTARGCPYSCSFCSDRRLWGGRVRRRSVDHIVRELTELGERYDVSVVDFADGTFTYDKAYVYEFCEKYRDAGLGMKWRCTARYDNIDAELLGAMKEAGCAGLYLGLESGSSRVLESVNKRTTVQGIVDASRAIRESGLYSITAVLLGLPDEDAEDLDATLELMEQLETDMFDINCYMPLPGTPLYDALPEGERENIDWRRVGYKSFENYFNQNLSQQDLQSYVRRAYDIAGRTRARLRERAGRS